ncbi:MAG: glycerophosphodiester phosphodiesterase [Rhodobacteraceae bacterium]|nr:glycerophosphodiester phosphodiesterase [Paracoccaceae bacterium]
MHDFLEHDWMPGPLPIAHRGHSTLYPENTMEAFESAYNLGYRYLETDVHVTRDGKLVAFHDDDLDRMTDGAGRITEQDWNDLRRLKVAGMARIPLFTDLLDRWPNARFIVDPKEDNAVEPLHRVLAEQNIWDRVCVGSFSVKRILWLREQAGPRLCTSMTRNEVIRLRFASLGLPTGHFAAQCIQVPLRHRGIRVLTPGFIRAARQRNLPIQIWTINDRPTMEWLIEIGIDAIMTDDAALLKSLLQKGGLWQDSESSP